MSVTHPSELYSQLPVPENKETPHTERGFPFFLLIVVLIVTLFLLILVVWIFGDSGRVSGQILAAFLDPKQRIDGYSTA